MTGDKLIQTTENRQLQRLTPMQVRFVRMLEMSEPELEDEVNRALDEMPALEASPNNDSALSDNDFNETAEQMQAADYRDDDIPSYWLESRSASAEPAYIPIAENDEPSLYEYLKGQLDELPIDETVRNRAIQVIGNLDENGYLKRSYGQIADDITFSTSIETSENQVEEAAEIVRSLEPAGVGATDLRDCLLLQLQRMPEDKTTSIAIRIISKNFESLSLKHFDKISEKYSLSNDELRDVIDLIRSLNPKPGSSIGESRMVSSSSIIVPDLIVEVEGSGISLSLNSRLPELSLQKSFAEDFTSSLEKNVRLRSEDAIFVRSRREEASMFIKALEMRQQTLFNVMSAIIQLQRDFFLTGDEGKLRPMILKDVAAITGYDMSTVSRATSGKYVSTPSGIFPLKFFFNEKSHASSDENASISSLQVGNTIKKLIEKEDKRSPLTDRELSALLKEEGLNVARRTVAKYRERLGFPVSRMRREI